MPQPERAFPLDTPVPASFEAALRSMRDPAYMASERFQEQQWRANREGAWPPLIEFERVFVKRMRALGVPVFAHNMVRTNEEQAKLLADGVSRAGPGQSPHNFGVAVDIVHGVRAWDLKPNEWALLGHVGKEVARAQGLQLVWGGEWNFYDPAHWELEDWRLAASKFPFSDRSVSSLKGDL